MEAKLEKELSVLALKAAGLNHRCQTVLAMADLLSEYAQLTNAQQKVIANLTERVAAYEIKSVNPVGESVQGTSPATPR